MATHKKESASMQPHKKTVSAGSIFRQHVNKKTKDITRQPDSKDTKSNSKGNLEKMHDRSLNTSRAQKKVWKVAKTQPEVHPLVTEYKETSDDYRRHLYNTTALNINKTLESFLSTLHESTLHPASSGNPHQITTSAKITHEANKLCQPISQYQIRMTRTNTDGKAEHIIGTLETRMLDYEEYISRQKAEIEKLERDWEAIVGEIWKLGVHVLGENEMEQLLFCNTHEVSSSPAESTLFVPERGDSAKRSVGGGKRVTFEAEDCDEEHFQHLGFLYQPSRIRKEPVPVVEGMSEHVIENFEKEIEELGKAQMQDLEKVEKEYAEYWKKKTAQVALALGDD